jgi:hypothetical protein
MGQKIIGGVSGPGNDVSLEKNPAGIGDAVSIHLSQQAKSTAVWNLEVWVHLQQGSFILGTGNTVPPSAGSKPSRTVAIGTCPGATGWRVVARCVTAGEQAELTLDSSKCCASKPGVTFLDSGGDADLDVNIISSIVLHAIIDSGSVAISGPSNLITPWSNDFSIALQNSKIIKASAGTFRNLTIRVDSTLASQTCYLQIWNLAAIPADAVAVTALNSLQAPMKIVHVLGTSDLVTWDLGELGIPATAGICWSLSSTEFTKTIVAGAFCSQIGADYR